MNKMISLLKVEFSYTSTNEEELTVIEDQLVYLLDSTTDSELVFCPLLVSFPF